ncbi:MAG: hypothetical protein IPQ02_04045 [Saprospiraceae bacterium]|uniref:Uncharacterized protein n=1 Tax=Candidatus Defluviibacterium haderslevense TaxID=2981993 RepID=A0A9D7SB98_9BACT|nr:hypothetical protein [Candidatus Defluviibacterium haderslevense]MBL0235792.1 hypothetical protein [Candidatus Defluviibacterium haderslevense]
MKDKFIIQYNYGTLIFLFIGIIFLIFIFNAQPINLAFGICICILFMYLFIKESPYIELDEKSLLIKYFIGYKFEKYLYPIKDIERIEIYNNPRNLRYHNACIYVKFKNLNFEKSHCIAIDNLIGNKLIQKLSELGIKVIELDKRK